MKVIYLLTDPNNYTTEYESLDDALEHAERLKIEKGYRSFDLDTVIKEGSYL